MKKLLFALFCLFALLAAVPGQAKAQDSQDSAPAQAQASGGWPTPDQVVAKLDSKLALSDDQKAKITPIIADRQQKLKDLANSSGRRRKKARKMRSVIQDSNKKIEALLTDDQKQKYEQMEQEMRAQMRQRMQERNAQ